MKKVGKKKASMKKAVARYIPTGVAHEIDRRFTHYPPNRERIEQHEKMRAAMKRVATYVSRNAPDCRERSLALTKLEEAMFWANAAIARPKGDY